MAEIMRKACKANKLGTSGSSKVLLSRLLKAGIKKKSKAIAPKPSPTKKNGQIKKWATKHLQRQKITGAAKRMPFKATKGGGLRLSAADYFYNQCNGVLKRCRPQCILQPDGRMKLKEIKIVNGAHGPHPAWRLVKCV